MTDKQKSYGPLGKEFGVAVGASQAGIRINTDEIDDAMRVISGVCEKFGWELRTWDKAKGLQAEGKSVATKAKKTGMAGLDSVDNDGGKVEQAVAALESFLYEKPKTEADDEEEIIPVVLVMRNFNLALEGQYHERMVALSQHVVSAGKSEGKFIVGLMPAEAKLPPEIAPLFHVIDHELPDKEELTEIAREVISATDEDEEVDEEDLQSVAHAALGLTRLQAEGVIAAYQVQWTGAKANSPDRPTIESYVWKHKAKILNREGLVELRESKLKFEHVAGLNGFKGFLTDLLQHDPLSDEDPEAGYKGVVAVGPPGVGKSLMAYCVGNEHNIPTLLANPGNLMDQWVGGTEKNTRRFFQICKRMSPCTVVMDEIGQTMPSGKDSGNDVGKRLLGTFLTQMNDIIEPILWFFTSNDVENLHEAFTRAERVDAMFYVRMPDRTQRAGAWSLYLKKFFPATVGGKPDKRAFEPSFKKALAAVQADKGKSVDPLVRVLMTLDKEKQEASLATLQKENVTLYEAVKKELIDDEGWTPAEIRACCRLSRRLKKSLHETAKRVGHVCLGPKGEKMLARLDRWAVNVGALDAETGELYEPPEEEDDEVEDETEGRKKRKKVRRTVRRLD